MSDVKQEGEEGRVPLTTRLDRDLHHRFKLACVSEGKTMQDVVEEFIEWWTKRREESQ